MKNTGLILGACCLKDWEAISTLANIEYFWADCNDEYEVRRDYICMAIKYMVSLILEELPEDIFRFKAEVLYP